MAAMIAAFWGVPAGAARVVRRLARRCVRGRCGCPHCRQGLEIRAPLRQLSGRRGRAGHVPLAGNPGLVLALDDRMKLGDIASALGCDLKGAAQGAADLEISGAAGLEEAGPSELTFLSNPKYAPLVRRTRAAAVLVESAVADCPAALLLSANPYLDFARALPCFTRPKNTSPASTLRRSSPTRRGSAPTPRSAPMRWSRPGPSSDATPCCAPTS